MNSSYPSNSTTANETPAAERAGLEGKLFRFLERPRLGWWLAGMAILLSSPCLFIGFYLDDYVLRYIYSELEGAQKLFEIYNGGYGIATGDSIENHWQIEQGHAPWWMKDDLFIRLFRPISTWTHLLDGWLWLDSAFAMHAHSLLWLGLLVLAATRLYRGAHGALLGGMAALLFSVDHTKGFVVGYICNRHALVTATFGVLALDQFVRYRAHGSRLGAVLGPLLYAAALAGGESAVAMAGYAVSYAAFAERGSLVRRALGVAPWIVITIAWRVFYTLAGYGAHGSGLYIDPGRDTARYLGALLERSPVLLLGQFFAPPAELYVITGETWATVIWVFALVFVFALVLALIPLLRRSRTARFWTAGALLSLVPACSTYPHNRQLLFTSFGAMALIAELWHLHAVELEGQSLSGLLSISGKVGAVVLFAHLIVSPLVLPLTSCSIAFSAPLHRAIDDVGDEVAGRDAVFVTAPEYFAVRLVQLSRRVEGQPLPRRWRALSFGPETVVVNRLDGETLRLDYQGGILTDPLLGLYRDKRLPMAVGDRVELEGLTIEVRSVTDDGRVASAEFRFDENVDADTFRFYYWKDGGFAQMDLPSTGQSVTLPPARLNWGLK